MKTPPIKGTPHEHPQNSQPFFNKSKEGNFFSKSSESNTPFFGPKSIQPKLKIGAPNDKYEQEADVMAEQVVQTSMSKSPHGGTNIDENNAPPSLQTKCSKCEEEENIQAKPLQQKSTGGEKVATPNMVNQLNQSKGNGSPLSDSTNGFMSKVFQSDFSGVKVHTGNEAIQMNQGLNARAFTHGKDIYFNQGEYNPNSTEGKKLLGHELTHVVQQDTQLKINKQEATPTLEEDPELIAGDVTERGEHVEVESLSYAFFYTGDNYGTSARTFFETYYPEHIRVSSTSFEHLFNRLHRDVQSLRRQGKQVHVDEIVLVTHANKAGGLQIPLAANDVSLPQPRNFNPWDLAALQEEFQDRTNQAYNQRQRFRRRRREVISQAIDENTSVIVRGCEFGQSQDGMDALRSLFGGHVFAWAPTGFQGFEVADIGSSHIATAEEAFDMLVSQGLIPGDLNLSPEDKIKYLAHEFQITNRVPSQFFVMGSDARERMRVFINTSQGRSEAAEAVKDRGHGDIPSLGNYWGLSSMNPSEIDRELNSLPLEEIERRARILHDNYQPEYAPMLIRLRTAWENNLTTLDAALDDNSGDPLAGLPPISLFGDSNLVAIDAARFEETIAQRDTFEEDELMYEPPSASQNNADNYENSLGTEESDEALTPDSPNNTSTPNRGSRPQPDSPSRANNPQRRRATPEELAQARDFTKSRELSEPEPECEFLRPGASQGISAENRAALANQIAGTHPETGLQTSDYISRADLVIGILTSPTYFVSSAGPIATASGATWTAGGAALAGLELTGLFAPIVLGIVGFAFTLSEARDRQEKSALAFGLQRGLNRLAEDADQPLGNGTVDRWVARNWAREAYTMKMQTAFSYPLPTERLNEIIREGMQSVIHSSNRALDEVARRITLGMRECGMSENEIDQTLKVIMPNLRLVIVREVIRAGQAALNRRREALEEED